jgi:hypothetical protein
MSRDLIRKPHYSWWKRRIGDNFTTFKNYTRCHIMICIAYDEFKLDRLSASISASKEAGVGFEMGRRHTDMSFLLLKSDRINRPHALERMINHGECHISVFIISPQHYNVHSNDLTQWKELSMNMQFDARKYNYHVLKENEGACTPAITHWRP